jgi:RNA polymerase sigma factor for flagellar operon FliA
MEDSPENLFLRLLPQVDRAVAYQVRRHRLPTADGEDFAQYVKLKLIENDYAVLRKFQGRSSLSTYVTSVVSNAFQDFRNSLWGKYRASAEAQRLGPLAVLLEQCLVRDGLAFEEACSQMTSTPGIEATRPELERLAGQLPPRVRRRAEPQDVLDYAPAPDRADANVRTAEKEAFRRRLWTALNRELGQLAPEDAALLALKYKSRKMVSEISTFLGLPQKALYRRLEALQKRLRISLENDGLNQGDVRGFLEDEG